MAKGPLKVSGLIGTGRILPMQGVAPSILATPKSSNTLPDAGVEFMVDIDLLVDSPYQALIRRALDPLRVDEIGQSLKKAGQSTAIEVRPLPDGRYELIKGHYRKYGGQSIGWTQLRALLVHADDRQAKRDLMLDNEGTTPTEYSYAHMFQSVLDDGECSVQADVAEYFGCSQAKVSNCLGMLKLAPAVLAKLDNKPGLFGAAAAKVVRALWDQHPQYHDLILQALNDLDDSDSELRQVKQNKLRQSVEHLIAERKRQEEKAAGRTPPPKQRARREIIKGHTGQECYVTILKETGMTVEIKDTSIDRARVQAAVNKALRELVAETGSSPDDE